MRSVGRLKHLLALFGYMQCPTMVHGHRGHQPQASVMMLMVVPVKEHTCPSTRVLDRAKTVWIIGPILHCLELRLRIRIVVGDVGSRMSLGDTQIGQQQGHRLGGHRTAAVGVQGQLRRLDPLLGTRLGDQLFGQAGRLTLGDQPANNVAAKDIQNGVQLVVGPLDWTSQLGQVPTPQLVRSCGQQFRFGVRGMAKQIASLAHLLTFL